MTDWEEKMRERADELVTRWLDNHNWHGEIQIAKSSPCAQELINRIATALLEVGMK